MTDRAKGTRDQLKGKDISGAPLVGVPEDSLIPTLAELGLSWNESAQARQGRPRRLSAGDGRRENGESARPR